MALPVDSMGPAIGATHTACAAQAFGAYVAQGDSAGNKAPILSAGGKQRISVAGINKLLGFAGGCAPRAPYGITLHQGLDTANALVVAVQLRCTTREMVSGQEWFSLPAGGACYVTDLTGDPQPYSGGLAAWYGATGPGARFAARAFLRPDPTGAWRKFNDKVDVTSTTYLYQKQVQSLLLDNGLSDSALVELRPIALPRGYAGSSGGMKPEGLYVTFAWVPDGVVLTDSVVSAKPYYQKACDLAVPCPTDCPPASFQRRTVGVVPYCGT